MLHDDDASVHNKFDTFYENLSGLVDKYAPVRKMTRKKVKLHAKPWINQKIIKLIKYKDKLKRKMKRKLTVIVNDAFSKGVYPSKPKTAKVVALHKKRASDNPTIDPYLYYQFSAE